MTEPYTPSVKGAREDLRDWLRRYRTARNRKRDLDNRLKNVLADLNDPPLGGQGSGSSGKEKRRRGYSDSGARQRAGRYLKSVYPQWFWSSYL